MKEIIDWLIRIEDFASRIYRETAAAFEDDRPIVDFFNRLAVDEAMHYHFMNSGLVCLKKNPDTVSDIVLDRQTIDKVEKPLQAMEIALQSGDIDKNFFLKSLVDSESSEWNDLFLYVIHSLKKDCPRFKQIGPSIQNHLRVIERFLAETPDAGAELAKIQNFSPVWKEKILVVDDTEPILALLRKYFSKFGEVHTAINGDEAFRKASREYFSVILSDIDMPVMSGIALYKRLKETYPDIGRRFVFISGGADSETLRYIEEENLVFMTKPFALSEIRQTVYDIMDRTTL
jgi:CheY-like chemotaxis protein/rubrerythrin